MISIASASPRRFSLRKLRRAYIYTAASLRVMVDYFRFSVPLLVIWNARDDNWFSFSQSFIKIAAFLADYITFAFITTAEL